MRNKTITVTVNSISYTKTVDVHRTLLEFIRDDLLLTGTKEGCNEGECGACTVLFDGRPLNSCMVLAVEADGHKILTVEGLAEKGKLHPLQEAFIEAGAVQCGFCTPGMLLSAKACLDEFPDATEEVIRKEMEGNLCRCTGYNRIIKAVQLAQEKMKNC
ncbi:MAG TPA: (2Fe-2S)-binding protein [Anaerovoracaceae bacterium]|nr:(2Fe-2S)-binding protein [Anaerovoracaceae bacterium]